MSFPVVFVGEGVQLYRVRHKLGSGGFGNVFIGTKADNPDEYVAIKLSSATSQLHHETDVYKVIQGGVGVASVKWSGKVKVGKSELSAMVMDKLGPSLEFLVKDCGRKFTLKTVLMLANEMIDRVEYIHSKGFLHRDIKPDNFVMGTGHNDNTLFIIDFGLAKEYLDKVTKRHIQMSRNDRFVGTLNFASLNAHHGMEQGRRDDLESVGYTLVYFLLGTLPWKGLKAENAKQLNEKIIEVKLSTSPKILCKDLPPEFELFFIYCRNLAFAEKPDYRYLKVLFSEIFRARGFMFNHAYDWAVNAQRWSEQLD
ncbi:Casein kinase I isoform delta [Orchesella cincta]|uniref:non-specific serine/threonine protein kinase n=1 Tax=Orchesella cincta TaxID=48709 RepID=A0A1D2N6N4_ORCCI|nr:Casein kinase I isoform delta [Orchesella cincta]